MACWTFYYIDKHFRHWIQRIPRKHLGKTQLPFMFKRIGNPKICVLIEGKVSTVKIKIEILRTCCQENCVHKSNGRKVKWHRCSSVVSLNHHLQNKTKYLVHCQNEDTNSSLQWISHSDEQESLTKRCHANINTRCILVRQLTIVAMLAPKVFTRASSAGDDIFQNHTDFDVILI